MKPASIAAAFAWATGAWASLGVVAVTSQSTIARAGFLPALWVLAALAIGAAVVVSWLRLSRDDTAPLWLALAAWLPWLPGPIPPAFLVFDGPLARVVVLLAAALVGDEPHYLVITQSLLYDGDLQIENNHRRGDYMAYAGRDLRPDFHRRGRNGAIYSIHAPGVSALVLPAFAAGGYTRVVVFLALLFGVAGALTWRASYQLTGDATSAWIGWTGVILSAENGRKTPCGQDRRDRRERERKREVTADAEADRRSDAGERTTHAWRVGQPSRRRQGRGLAQRDARLGTGTEQVNPPITQMTQISC